jgi:hypothetical protein
VTSIQGFDKCVNFREIIISKTSCLKIILRFSKCLALSRIEIPVSVEIVHESNECPALQEIRFVENSQIQQIFGLNQSPNAMIKMHWDVMIDQIQLRVFIEYPENNEVKQRMREFQLGSSRYFEKRKFRVFPLGFDSNESESMYWIDALLGLSQKLAWEKFTKWTVMIIKYGLKVVEQSLHSVWRLMWQIVSHLFGLPYRFDDEQEKREISTQ